MTDLLLLNLIKNNGVIQWWNGLFRGLVCERERERERGGGGRESRSGTDFHFDNWQGDTLVLEMWSISVDVRYVQCNQAREQNFLKPYFWAKNYIDRPT